VAPARGFSGAIAVLTFFAGFIAIVGALAAGGLAVLVALVSNGPTTALIVLAIIVTVQQLESNVLQGRSPNLHAAIVLLASPRAAPCSASSARSSLCRWLR